MATPKFVQRIARIPEVIDVLAAYPEGLPLRDLAAQFDVDPETMSQDIRTYVDLDSWGWSEGVFAFPAIEFISPEGDDDSEESDDVTGSTQVRVVPDATARLGAEYLSAGDLAVIYTAGRALLDIDPDDTDLAEALDVIVETMYGEPSAAPRRPGTSAWVSDLQDAQQQRCRVRILYSNAWSSIVKERVIEPLRLVQTKRGWEVDAGPVGPEGNLRTYLLSNIRSVEVLDETFESPAHASSLLERQRRTTAVQMTITQDARWAARLFAEHLEVIEEDEESVTLALDLLPPFGERVALIMLASGTSTKVVPGSLLPEALAFVEGLRRHHAGE